MQFTTYTVLALAATISATQIEVKVGDGGLSYSPNDFTAEVGDEIVFSFFPKNHTVTQSSFAKPCVPLAGGFFSGFIPSASAASEKTFTIKVTTTDPIWFYCSQSTGSHCKAGMVGGINIKQASGKTLAAFKNLAAKTNGSITDLVPTGGAVVSTIALAPSNNTSASASASVTGASTSSFTSKTIISTEQTSTATAAYTTNGVVYTSGQAVPFSTVYTTTSTGATVVASSTVSPSASASKTANAAAGSLSGGLFAGVAAVLGGLAMI